MVVKLITVVLNFPTVIAIFIVYAKAIYIEMFENPCFTAQAAKVTKLNTDIAALKKVKADLRSLRNDVQERADADPANAGAIIASSGMSAKYQGHHGKQQNSAEDGVDQGSVDLTGEGAGAYVWWLSTDEINRTLLPASLTAKTTVSDLTP